jgi:DNA replication protein DnaC
MWPLRLSFLRWLSWRNTGAFLDDAVNVVAAGKPGVDKSHALAAIPNELVAGRQA